ncbi:MAG: roadblock/LC7 domain-containing protein [Methanosarcinales archaeon]|nr:roadblock/LC7 domain-containing protein [Methanosarcinales archaeon]
MATTRKEMYETILRELESDSDGITSAVVTNDGLIMATTSVQDLHYELFAAVCASSVSSSVDAMKGMANEVTDKLIMESTNHRIVVMRVTERSLLTIFASIDTQLGLILIKMDRACEKIRKIR